MTLRALMVAQGEAAPEAPPTVASLATTLAFAFDRSYLEPFKTFAHSLLRTGSYLDSPVAIYSADRELFDDPFVRACVDKPVHLQGARMARLETLARDSVLRPERAEWNRGTFLKWAVFEKQETQNLLFLDVDMLALQDIETPISQSATKPFSCCPQFQKTMKPAEDDPDRALLAGQLLDLLHGVFSGGHSSRVNSGVLHLSGRMLDGTFLDEMVELASSCRLINEQSFFSEYFARNPKDLKMMPAALNFQESYLAPLSLDDQKKVLDEIRILHFAGKLKPWQADRGRFPSLGKLLWFRADFERKQRFRL